MQEDNEQFEYNIIRRKRKTIGISVSEDGVVISAPKWVSLKQIKELVDKKAEWIIKRLRIIETEKEENKPKFFETGEILLYLGEKHLIHMVPKRGKIRLNGALIEICHLKGPDSEKDQLEIKEKIRTWYREMAREVFKEHIGLFSAELGVKPQRLFIKEQKTRWGSCSSKGNINLNWRLIMAPMGIIDYVIVHELAHLRHMNHSREFWATVESVMPDYKARRKWLKQNNWNLKF